MRLRYGDALTRASNDLDATCRVGMACLREHAVSDDLEGRRRTYLVVDIDKFFTHNPTVDILAYLPSLNIGSIYRSSCRTNP